MKWQFRKDLHNQYINSTSSMTFKDAEERLNYLEAKVSVLTKLLDSKSKIKNRDYYEFEYKARMGEIYAELAYHDVDDIYDAGSVEFDKTANAEQVVGYYLVNEGTNALNQWLENIDGISLSVQDREVTDILKDLDRNGYK